MQDQQGGGDGGGQTRRTFLSRAFVAATVWVVPGVVGVGAPSLALAQDGKDPKNPEPTRTSDRQTPQVSPSSSRAVPLVSPSSSSAPRASSSTRSTKESRENTTLNSGTSGPQFDLL